MGTGHPCIWSVEEALMRYLGLYDWKSTMKDAHQMEFKQNSNGMQSTKQMKKRGPKIKCMIITLFFAYVEK